MASLILSVTYKHCIMKLFNEFKFEEFAQTAVKQAISKVNNVDILNADLRNEAQKIIDSLTFTVPVLNKTEITSSLALEDASGKTHSQDKIAIENDDISVTATYTVPFSGNSEIFRIIPENNQYTYDYSFELKKDSLSFKLRTDSKDVNLSEEWKAELVKSSYELITSIEITLLQLEPYFKEFKNDMIGPVIHSLKSKKEELLEASAVAKDINIFNSNNE